MRLLQKGPKFGVQPGVPAHDLIAMNRKVADKATDDNRDRCLLEGVDCLRKFAPKTTDSQHSILLNDIVSFFQAQQPDAYAS